MLNTLCQSSLLSKPGGVNPISEMGKQRPSELGEDATALAESPSQACPCSSQQTPQVGATPCLGHSPHERELKRSIKGRLYSVTQSTPPSPSPRPQWLLPWPEVTCAAEESHLSLPVSPGICCCQGREEAVGLVTWAAFSVFQHEMLALAFCSLCSSFSRYYSLKAFPPFSFPFSASSFNIQKQVSPASLLSLPPFLPLII